MKRVKGMRGAGMLAAMACALAASAAGGTVVSSQLSVVSAMADAAGQAGAQEKTAEPQKAGTQTAASSSGVKIAAKAPEVKVSAEMAAAQGAYSAGRFLDAEELAKKLSDGDKYSLAGLLLRGKLDLSAGRLREATQDLVQARRLAPQDKEAARLLAEAYMRGDHLHEAAVAYAAAGEDERSDQAQSFGVAESYRIDGMGNADRIKLLRVDPVPVVAVRLNGGDVLYFLLDTGAGQTVIDRAVAEKLKLTTFGEEPGAFAAGQAMPVVYARVDSLALGVWVLRDLPVILKTVPEGAGAAASGSGGSYKIGGVIGTELLYHFLSTIDFGAGELVLRRRIAQVTGPLRTEFKGERAVEVPFRLVGDHYILADGTVNGVGPMTFYVDNGEAGLAGYAFSAPASTLRAARIVVSDQLSVVSVMPSAAAGAAGAGESQGNSKSGGAEKGKVESKGEGAEKSKVESKGEGAEKSKVESKSEGAEKSKVESKGEAGTAAIPFAIETLTLGPLTRRNLTGVAGRFPASVETSTGVKIGGVISQTFFRPYAVTFDFEQATLWVVTSGGGAGR